MRILALTFVALVAISQAKDVQKRNFQVQREYGVPELSPAPTTQQTPIQEIEVVDAKQTLTLPAETQSRTPFRFSVELNANQEAQNPLPSYETPQNFLVNYQTTPKPASFPHTSYGIPIEPTVNDNRIVADIVRPVPHKTYGPPPVQDIIVPSAEPAPQPNFNTEQVIEFVQPRPEPQPQPQPIPSFEVPQPQPQPIPSFEVTQPQIPTFEVPQPQPIPSFQGPQRHPIEIPAPTNLPTITEWIQPSVPHQTYGVPEFVKPIPTEVPIKFIPQPAPFFPTRAPVHIPRPIPSFVPQPLPFVPKPDCNHEVIRPQPIEIIENVKAIPSFVPRPQPPVHIQPQFVVPRPQFFVPQPQFQVPQFYRPAPVAKPGFGQKIQQHFAHKYQKAQRLVGAASQKVQDFTHTLASVPQKLFNGIHRKPTFSLPPPPPQQIHTFEYQVPQHHIVQNIVQVPQPQPNFGGQIYAENGGYV